MAEVTLKSGQITNRDAATRVFNNPGVSKGMMCGSVGRVQTNADDSANSIIVFCTIPSNAIVHSLRLYSDDSGNTGAMDVGLYRTTKDGGAVVDADHFASAVDINSAALNGSDILHESGQFSLEEAEKPVWEALGLSADPNLEYDVCGTLTAAVTAATDIVLKIQYAV